jgi:hypothetical protein
MKNRNVRDSCSGVREFRHAIARLGGSLALPHAYLLPAGGLFVDEAAGTGTGSMSGLLDQETWREFAGGLNWKAWLTEAEDALEVSSMRLNTHTGRPLATDSFLSKLETFVGRRLVPLPVGRPRKARRVSKK